MDGKWDRERERKVAQVERLINERVLAGASVKHPVKDGTAMVVRIDTLRWKKLGT